MQISGVLAPRQVRPGEDVELVVTLAGENGAEVSKKVHYRLPAGEPPGVLYFTAADATTTNALDVQSATGTQFRSQAQMFGYLNSLRTNTKAYVRVWRAETAYSVDGRDLPNPPPSVALILTREQVGASGLLNWRGSKLAEIEIPVDENVVVGSKTAQVEVKE
jgi:hypothetical protein